MTRQDKKAKELDLTAQQRAFLDNYALSNNLDEAWTSSGYKSNKHKLTNNILSNTRCLAYLNMIRGPIARKQNIDAERIVEGIAKIAFEIPPLESTADRRLRLDALKILGEYLGMFKEGNSVTVNNFGDSGIKFDEMSDVELGNFIMNNDIIEVGINESTDES